MTNHSEIIHDKEAKRFRLPLENAEAFVEYSEKEGVLRLLYAETPFELRGQGIGRELVEKTFDYIQKNELKAEAVCSFIRSVHRSSNKWDDCIS